MGTGRYDDADWNGHVIEFYFDGMVQGGFALHHPDECTRGYDPSGTIDLPAPDCAVYCAISALSEYGLLPRLGRGRYRIFNEHGRGVSYRPEPLWIQVGDRVELRLPRFAPAVPVGTIIAVCGNVAIFDEDWGGGAGFYPLSVLGPLVDDDPPTDSLSDDAQRAIRLRLAAAGKLGYFSHLTDRWEVETAAQS